MTIRLILLLIAPLSLLIGCNDPVKIHYFVEDTVDRGNSGALFAWECALKNKSIEIDVNPDVTPDAGKCKECDGKGKVDYDHDGNYDSDCSICGGDGVVGNETKTMDSKSLKEFKDRIDKILADSKINKGTLSKENIVKGEIKSEVPVKKIYYVIIDSIRYIWNDDRLAFVSEADETQCIFVGSTPRFNVETRMEIRREGKPYEIVDILSEG